jgi:quercetin dioxygenase-like cupin family protein
MAAVTKKSFDTADATSTVDKGKFEFVNLAEMQAVPITFHPGWRWSESIKPRSGTPSCQIAQCMYTIAGRMVVKMDDGSETEIAPGELAVIPPGHDAWIIDDESFVAVDIQA